MLEFLNQGWVGTLIGTVGLIFAVRQMYYKNYSRLSYQWSGTRLISSRRKALPNELEVRYLGQILPQVSITDIALWNEGNQPIKREDIAARDPIGIKMQHGSRIIQADITRQSSDAINCSIEIVETVPYLAGIDFDFLNPKDGFVVRLVHTGDVLRPALVGTVVGALNAKERGIWSGGSAEGGERRGEGGGNLSLGLPVKFRRLMVGWSLVSGSAFLLMATFYEQVIPKLIQFQQEYAHVDRIATFISGGLFVALGIMLAMFSGKRPPAKLYRPHSRGADVE